DGRGRPRGPVGWGLPILALGARRRRRAGLRFAGGRIGQGLAVAGAVFRAPGLLGHAGRATGLLVLVAVAALVGVWRGHGGALRCGRWGPGNGRTAPSIRLA